MNLKKLIEEGKNNGTYIIRVGVTNRKADFENVEFYRPLVRNNAEKMPNGI